MECHRQKRFKYVESYKAARVRYRPPKPRTRIDDEFTSLHPNDPRKAATARHLADPRNRAKVVTRAKNRRAADPVFAAAHRVRRLIGISLSRGGYKKNAKAAEILGCTWAEFARHIELQFLPGMSWENRSLWHIDHIVALATAVTEADVIALNHFTNLRPLWGPENLRKGATQTHLL
jgi:hypothetical protein